MSNSRNCCFARCLTSGTNNDREELIQTPPPATRSIKDYESLDYDQCFNEPYIKLMKSELKKHGRWFGYRKEFLSWIVIFFVGFFTALVAFFIDIIVKKLSSWKLTTVTKSMDYCQDHGCLITSLLVLLAFNVSFCIVASAFVVFIEPLAAGSGIPEIKCYLNGVKVRNVVRFRTLVAKALGVLFSVSGGLLVGKEGPMIHSGGVIGAGVPQFQSQTFKKLRLNLPYFRSDRDKRDFVSAGAAAGVAAAFGAPIGGVLFSLEEGSSFWNQSLTWKTLFCTMASTFTLNFFLSGVETNAWGTFYQNGLLTFGVFQCDSSDKNCHLWTAVDLFIFIVMGFIGGLLGAVFNAINTKLTIFRLNHLSRRGKLVKILEVVLIGIVTSMVAYFAPILIGKCKPISSSNLTLSSQEHENTVQQFLCPNGTYNDMATLMYNTQETAIKQLFHNSGAFSLLSLAIFFVFFFLLSCWTYGSSVPSGLFVPCILCGASYGRFCATVLHQVFNLSHVYLGTFSLIGAAAFLGGVVRMTISLTVILIECTNEITLALPIMVTLMVAKWAGDIFNHGLYDIHIHLKGVPLLEWDPPHGSTILQASDIMQTRLKYVFPHTRLRSLVNLLRTTAHNAFPVITMQQSPKTMSCKTSGDDYDSSSVKENIAIIEPSDALLSANLKYKIANQMSRMSIERTRAFSLGSRGTELVRVDYPLSMSSDSIEQASIGSTSGRSETTSLSWQDNLNPLIMHGIILRSTLTTLLKRGVGYNETIENSAHYLLDHDEMQKEYPRFTDIHEINTEEIQLQNILDLTPYMNNSPYVVYPNTPLSQVFNLFRTMGLRHLPVINNSGEVVGLITRHDLMHDYIEQVTARQLSCDNDNRCQTDDEIVVSSTSTSVY